MYLVAVDPKGDIKRREGACFCRDFVDVFQASHIAAFSSALPARWIEEGGGGGAVHDGANTFFLSDVTRTAPAVHYLENRLSLLQTQRQHSLRHMLCSRGSGYTRHNGNISLQSVRGATADLDMFVQ